MKNLQIFIEHVSHKHFLQDFVKAKYTNTLPDSCFIIIENRQDIPCVKNSFIKHTKIGGTNLVILDNLIGIRAEKADLANFRARLGLTFHEFFFPDDANVGCLDTLLYNMIVPRHNTFKTCFSAYSQALNLTSTYDIPSAECKIYCFLDAISHDKKAPVDYTNTQYWDIHHNYLQPLITFGNVHFI